MAATSANHTLSHLAPDPSLQPLSEDSISFNLLLVIFILVVVVGWSLKLCLKRYCLKKELEGNVVLMLHLHTLRDECVALELFRTFECPGMVAFAPKHPPRGFRVEGYLRPKLLFTCRNHVATFKRTAVQEEVPTRARLGPMQALKLRRMLRLGERNLILHYEWRHNGNAFLVPLATPTWSRVAGNPSIVE